MNTVVNNLNEYMKLKTLALIFTGILITSVNLMAQKETLTGRQQAIVAIAANEARGDLAGLASSIECGLDNGLTVNQVKEILSHLYAYTGFPRSLNGLGTLQKVLDQRTADGKQTEIGPEASPIPEDFDALKVGTKVQTQLSGLCLLPG